MAPSYAQVAQRKKRDDPAILKDVFMKSVKELLKNKGYILLLISYGINVGAFFAISTLLNQFILRYFPVSELKLKKTCLRYISVIILNAQGHEEDVGRIGLTLVLCGLGGSIICGYILDKTHLYK